MGGSDTKYLKYDMRSKICIVTGANSGIGKETARMLAGDGAHVILACRSLDRGNHADRYIKDSFPSASLDVMELDLGDFDSVREFVKIFSEKYDHLDVLVNNAGIFKTTFQKSNSGHEMSLAVNHLGVFLLTTLLLPSLEKTPKIRTTTQLDGPRVVIVSADAYTIPGPLKISDLTNFNEGSFENIKSQLSVYGCTKLCNLLFAEELHTKIIEFGSNIIVNSLEPGWVHTEINRENQTGFGSLFNAFGALAAKTPQEGGLCSLFVACDPFVNGKSGKFFVGPFEEGVLRDFACNQKAAKELWEFSEEAVNYKVDKWF